MLARAGGRSGRTATSCESQTTRSTTFRLLRDVAEVFKHHKPDRPTITVESSKHITLGGGWGEMNWAKENTADTKAGA